MKIIDLGQEEVVKKGHHLLRLDERCQDLFFVQRGMLRVYYLKDGVEVTDWFGTAGTTMTAMESFHLERVSDQLIQAVTETQIIRISKKELFTAMTTSKEINQEYLNLITQHLLRVQQRIKALQFYTARERYDLLLEKNPEVVQFALRTQIASYLGISLETLSRVTK